MSLEQAAVLGGPHEAVGRFFEGSEKLDVHRSEGAAKSSPLSLGMGAVMAGVSRLLGAREPIMRQVDVHSAGWPEEAAPLKIAFLSDFHCGSANYKLADLSKTVDQVNREKPDLVILGGDYVNQYDSPDAPKGWGGPLDPGFEPPETIAKELGRLKAEAGVFAVLGNHDYHLGGERVAQALNANGITVLANSSAMTRARGQDFAVAGVDDHTQTPDGDVTLKGVPYGKPHVVVGHNPTDLQDMRGDAGVMMAGHTHGGQVGGRLLTALCKLPFMQRLIHSPWGEKHFPKELKEHLESPQGITESRGGAPLYVSSGLGTSSAPLRFGPGAEREVAIITLSGKNPFEPDEAGQKPATTAPPTRKAGEKLGM